MILSNNEIRSNVSSKGMIQSFDPDCLKNSSYKIRIGQIIEPDSGKIVKKKCKGYFLKPNEVVIIESKESIKIPEDITASYSGLYSTSSKGLLLINASMIEPGYEGKLSCFIVNFSSKKKLITEGDEIAKINFHSLTSVPSPFIPEVIESEKYLKNLREDANLYNKSFLDIHGIEEGIFDKTTKKVSRQIAFGGFLILFLVAIATLEPFFSRFVWEKTGLVTNTEKYKIEEVSKEILKSNKDNVEVRQLKQKLDSLENVVKKIKRK